MASKFGALLAFVAGVHATEDTARLQTPLFRNASLGDRHAAKQVDYELELLNGTLIPLKNKNMLAGFFVLNLNFIGFDRCYLGDTVGGIIKGVTLGGLCFWAIFDWFVVFDNMMRRKEAIDSFGLQARFEKDQVISALCIFLSSVAVQILSKQMHKTHKAEEDDRHKNHEVKNDRDEPGPVQYQQLRA